jgi:hypothetical protein
MAELGASDEYPKRIFENFKSPEVLKYLVHTCAILADLETLEARKKTIPQNSENFRRGADSVGIFEELMELSRRQPKHSSECIFVINKMVSRSSGKKKFPGLGNSGNSEISEASDGSETATENRTKPISMSGSFFSGELTANSLDRFLEFYFDEDLWKGRTQIGAGDEEDEEEEEGGEGRGRFLGSAEERRLVSLDSYNHTIMRWSLLLEGIGKNFVF